MSLRANTKRVSVFFQSPTWRYEYASRLFGKNARITSSMRDEYIVRLLRIMRAERVFSAKPITQDEIQRRLLGVDPDMAMAYEFSKNTNKLAVHSLDGHLLTTMTNDEIADRFCVDTGVIDAYSRCFFDVRDRLENIEYIAGFVIGPVLQSGIESLNTRLLCKYFGFFGGPLVLQTILYGATVRNNVVADDEVLGYLERKFEQSMMIQSATTAMLHHPSRFDLRTLIEGYVGLKSIRRDSDGTEADWVAGLLTELRKVHTVPRGMAARQQFENDNGFSVGGVVLEPRASVKIAAMAGDVDAIRNIQDCKDDRHLEIITSRRVSESDPNAVKLDQ